MLAGGGVGAGGNGACFDGRRAITAIGVMMVMRMAVAVPVGTTTGQRGL